MQHNATIDPINIRLKVLKNKPFCLSSAPSIPTATTGDVDGNEVGYADGDTVLGDTDGDIVVGDADINGVGNVEGDCEVGDEVVSLVGDGVSTAGVAVVIGDDDGCIVVIVGACVGSDVGAH